MASLPGRTAIAVRVVVVVPPVAVWRRFATTALSGCWLPLAEELLLFLLHGTDGRTDQCRRRPQSPAGGLFPAGIGRGITKRPLLSDLGEIADNVAVPGGHVHGGEKVVQGQGSGEVWVVVDLFSRRVRLGECRPTGSIVPLIVCLLPPCSSAPLTR